MKKRQKFTKLDWFCITALYKIYDYTGAELAKDFKTSRQHIFRIVKRTEKIFDKEIFTRKEKE